MVNKSEDVFYAEPTKDVRKLFSHERIFTMPVSEVQNIPYKLVYDWVRKGVWKRKHFEYWLTIIKVIE